MKYMKAHKFIFLTLVAALLCQSPTGVFACQNNSDESIQLSAAASEQWLVESDKVTTDEERGKTVVRYFGNVEAKFGDYQIKADNLTINEADKKASAEGSVVFTRKDQSISCTSLEFFYEKQNEKVLITF